MRRFLCLIPAFFLVACDSVEAENYRPLPRKLEMRKERGKIGGGDGIFNFGGEDDKNAGPTLGVSGFLWRATLDTLSFMPLAAADPFGGTILTDWYSEPNAPDERFKINALILAQELRADGVKVKLFKQVKGADGMWKDAQVSDSTERKLEDTILTRARELKVQSLN